MGVIYKATNLINGKTYIGQTKRSLETRQKEHEKGNLYHRSVLHDAIIKYGKDNFDWSILEVVNDERLDQREKYWIQYYDTFKKGYNLTQGGDNANALLNWKRQNPDLVKQYALKGLQKANKYWDEHPKERETQLKIAHDMAGKAVARKVRCIQLNLIFSSIAEAERWSVSDRNPNGKKASHQHISKVCAKQYGRKTAGGYHWEYVE